MFYGWQPISPTGEKPIKCTCENIETYLRNDGRVVTNEDAKALATALENGLPDIPDEKTITHKKEEVGIQDMLKETQLTIFDLDLVVVLPGPGLLIGCQFDEKNWDKMNLFEKLAGAQSKIRDFITYLRGGGFEIH